MTPILVPAIHEFAWTVNVCAVRCRWYDWLAALVFGVGIVYAIHQLGRYLYRVRRDENS